jgi:hypothetical protein
MMNTPVRKQKQHHTIRKTGQLFDSEKNNITYTQQNVNLENSQKNNASSKG